MQVEHPGIMGVAGRTPAAGHLQDLLGLDLARDVDSERMPNQPKRARPYLYFNQEIEDLHG